MFTLLFFGDIVGRVGRRVLREQLPRIVDQHNVDVVLANGENAAGGLGIDPGTAEEIFKAGVDLITTGNHVWSKKDIRPYLDEHSSRIIRPENYPEGAAGKGWLIWQASSGLSLGVVNLLGRVFIPDLVDCPFRTADEILSGEVGKADFVLVDFHAEATSEKVAMGYHLDGRASVVLGTHTHVQTADERVLPQGTAYLTDVGMCGPYDSVIGVKSDIIVERFLSGLPMKFDIAKGRAVLNAVLVRFDAETKKVLEIERIRGVY